MNKTRPVNWRRWRWMMEQPAAMRVAQRLGRSRGRMRVIDRLHAPPRCEIQPDLTDWHGHGLAACWLGHATVLFRIGGLNVLTDPVLSSRVGLGFGLLTGGPRRLVGPALSRQSLPPIDLILVSHAHFDHLDRPTLRRLDKKAVVVTSAHNRDLIEDLGFEHVHELNWGESIDVKSVKVTAHPVKHWGARTVIDRHRGFAAFTLQSDQHRVLFGGDTAFHEGFRELGKVDVAALGIGAYDPWIESHANPEEAWAMSRHAQAECLVPIHHSTFVLSHEPMDDPMRRLLLAAGDEAARVVIRRIGEQWAVRRRAAGE